MIGVICKLVRWLIIERSSILEKIVSGLVLSKKVKSYAEQLSKTLLYIFLISYILLLCLKFPAY